MAKKKLSVSLNESVAREGIRVAQQKGLSFSAWLNEAAIQALISDPTLPREQDWYDDPRRPSGDDAGQQI